MYKLHFLTTICLGICLIAAVTGRTTIAEPSKQPIYIKSGERIAMKCLDDEGSSVYWYKNNILFDTATTNNTGNGTFYDFKLTDGSQGVGYLTKDVVALDDEGLYSCRPNSGAEPYNVQVFVFELTGTDVTVNKSRQHVTLTCTVTNLNSYTMSWYRNGKEIVADETKYIIVANNDSLQIRHAGEADYGEYMCAIELNNDETYNATVTLKSVAHIHAFQTSKNIIEGDPLTLECKAYGYPVPTVTWYKGEEPLGHSDSRLSYKDYTSDVTGVTVVNATFRLTGLTYDDRADYKCVATNGVYDQSAEQVILIRVKDKLAALWPFLGICAEVAILCVIIFVYERRRAKKLEEEERREEADHLTNSHGHKGNDEVRQRK